MSSLGLQARKQNVPIWGKYLWRFQGFWENVIGMQSPWQVAQNDPIKEFWSW
jgi:hypothetical protein